MTKPSTSHNHKREIFLVMFLALPVLSVLFLYLEHVTHFEFLLHLAAIPLEILLGAFLVERYLARKEKQGKLQQLMYIKSYVFRSEMRNVYISNFRALEEPKISIEKIKGSSLEELRAMRASVKSMRYRSIDELEPVIDAYVNSQRVFQAFMEWAITNDFEQIFQDMIYILHFIEDVKLFKAHHPDHTFIGDAARQPEMMEKIYYILRQGAVKFLDYAIELKEQQPEVFNELMADYQLAECMKNRKADGCAVPAGSSPEEVISHSLGAGSSPGMGSLKL